MRVYLAASLFTQLERVWNRTLAAAIERAYPKARVTLPQDIKIRGDYADPRNNAHLFARCIEGIDRADVVLAVVDGAEVDSGTSWEMGYAYAKGKPVVGLRTDFRPGVEHGVNIMLSRSCRYLVRNFSFQEDVNVVARDVARRLKRLDAARG